MLISDTKSHSTNRDEKKRPPSAKVRTGVHRFTPDGAIASVACGV
jgi:hypothetical protein